MLDYQTAKNLYEEIQTAATANGEDALVMDLALQVCDYAMFIVSEEIERTLDTRDAVQKSIAEETKCTIEKTLITTINTISLCLNIDTIKRVLIDDADKLKFARHVATIELEKIGEKLKRRPE